MSVWERNIDCCLLYTPRLGTEPATQAWALNGNWISDLVVCGTAPNQMSHVGQGLLHLDCNSSGADFCVWYEIGSSFLCFLFSHGCPFDLLYYHLLRRPFFPIIFVLISILTFSEDFFNHRNFFDFHYQISVIALCSFALYYLVRCIGMLIICQFPKCLLLCSELWG